MSAPRPFSWLHSALPAGVINALINGAIGWFIVPEGTLLPTWELPGLGADVVATAFGISFGTGLAVTSLARAELRAGKVLAPPISPRWREGFARWPRSTFHRAVNLGVISVVLFAPLPLLALWAFDVESVTRAAAIAFKAAFSFVQGALVTPVIAVAAMVTAPVLVPPQTTAGDST